MHGSQKGKGLGLGIFFDGIILWAKLEKLLFFFLDFTWTFELRKLCA